MPDLQAIAEHEDEDQTLALCRLALAIAALSGGNKDVVDRIQKLNERDQHALMRAIEDVSLNTCHPLQIRPESLIVLRTPR